MKIEEVRTVFKLDRPLEDVDKSWYDEGDYTIQRLEEGELIIWFGIKTNWKFQNGKWQRLEFEKGYVDCSEPEYEIEYRKLIENGKTKR